MKPVINKEDLMKTVAKRLHVLRIRMRQMTFLEHIMKKGGLENLTFKRDREVKRNNEQST